MSGAVFVLLLLLIACGSGSPSSFTGAPGSGGHLIEPQNVVSSGNADAGLGFQESHLRMIESYAIGAPPTRLAESGQPTGFAYVGAEYDGSSGHVSSIQATMWIPNGSAVSKDYYYAVLSIWDNAGSYDQIGIADFDGDSSPHYFGQWTLYWAALYADCGTGGSLSNSAAILQPNTEYTFYMSIGSNGYVSFDLYIGATASSSYLVYSSPPEYTGGTAFVESQTYSCGGTVYADYTNYVEIHTTYQTWQPEWSFFFSNILADGRAISSWISWDSCGTFEQCQVTAPGLMAYSTTSGDTVSVWDQWFTADLVGCTPGDGTCEYSEQRGDSITVDTEVSLAPDCQTILNGFCYGTGTTSMYEFPTSLVYTQPGCPNPGDGCFCPTSGSWTCSETPSSFAFTSNEPSFQVELTINVPSSASCTYYPIGLNVTEPSAEGDQGIQFPNLDWTSAQFLLYVTGCSGGGGCVAWGTPILTLQGYRPVQDLLPGQTLDAYNLTSGKLENVSLLDNNATSTNRLVDINHGFLEVTPTDQPIFIKNESYAGWLRDPQNLTVGDWIFDPVNSSWIFVDSVSLVRGHSEVYDVVTSGPNTFIANGALMDKKT